MYALTTDPDWFVDGSNTYWDYKHGGNVYSGDSMSFFERKSMVIMTLNGYYNNAVFADPLFKDAEIKLDKNFHSCKISDTLKIRCNKNPLDFPYIKAVKFNGTEIEKNYLTYEEITNGGELVFELE
jgi:hypothetical protein